MFEEFQLFNIVNNAQINTLYTKYLYTWILPLDRFPDLELQSQRNQTFKDLEKQFQIDFHKVCKNLCFHNSD